MTAHWTGFLSASSLTAGPAEAFGYWFYFRSPTAWDYGGAIGR
jgi:hypothetical protein